MEFLCCQFLKVGSSRVAVDSLRVRSFGVRFPAPPNKFSRIVFKWGMLCLDQIEKMHAQTLTIQVVLSKRQY